MQVSLVINRLKNFHPLLVINSESGENKVLGRRKTFRLFLNQTFPSEIGKSRSQQQFFSQFGLCLQRLLGK
jgi:hypothetical protein